MIHRYARRFVSLLLASALATPLFAAAPQDTPAVQLQALSHNGIVQVEQGLFSTSAGGHLQTQGEIPAGWHLLTGEYRTIGLPPMAQFNLQLKHLDWKQSYSAHSVMAASDNWTPLQVYVHLPQAGRAFLRLDSIPADDATKVELRNLKITPYQLNAQTNLLANHDFQVGEVGQFPSNWAWKDNAGEPGDYQLVADRTFRTGDRVMRVGSAAGQRRTLHSLSMPLPNTGEIKTTVWARSEQPGATLTLRVISQGWGWHKFKTFQLTDQWRPYEMEFPAPADVNTNLFWLRIDAAEGKPATVDFAEAAVVWLAPPAPAAATPATQANLLTNADFELGGIGWTLDYFKPQTVERHQRTAMSEAPRIVDRPDGDGRCMRLSGGSAVLSDCVPLVPGETYTLSFDVRGDGAPANLWHAVLNNNWQMYAADRNNISPDKWQRVELSFTWDKPVLHKRVYARFDASGPLLIDRVRLGRGKSSTFDAPPVEAALLPLEGGQQVFTHEQGEPAQMRLRIVQRPGAAGSLKVTAANAWAEPTWNLELPLSGQVGQSEQLVTIPTAEKGVFHVDVLAIAADGLPISLTQNRYAVIPPTDNRQPDGLPLFGVCYETNSYPGWHAQNASWHLQRLGVGMNRFFLHSPYETEAPPAEYIAGLRAQCQPQTAAGVLLIGCISLFPKSLHDEIADSGAVTPEQLERFGRHVRALVEPLKDEIRAWEIFNEGNLWRHKSGPKQGQRYLTPDIYVPLLKVAHQVIKEIDPQLLVFAPALNAADRDYLQKIMALGAGRYMDVFSIHPYRSTPDMPDVYPDLLHARAILDEYGFDGPIVNSEQYFAADLFMLRSNDEETSRGYYVPGDQELHAAGRTIRNFIHHAAAGAPYCAFATNCTLLRPGPDTHVLLFDLYAAYANAQRLLGSAGRGTPMLTGGTTRAFFFPDAPGGPLLTLHGTDPNLAGHLDVKGDYLALDIMGNPISPKRRELGLPVSTDPIYLRFAAGTTADTVAEALRSARVIGMGQALRVSVSAAGPDALAVRITNLHPGPITGTLELESLPPGWSATQTRATFQDVRPGDTAVLRFDLSNARMDDLASYEVGVRATAGESFVRTQQAIRPLFVGHIAKVEPDGDLSEWADARWLKLDARHLSKQFQRESPHAGDADLSARVAFAWNPQYLALAVEVTDDTHDPSGVIGEGWKGDSVQIYIDPLNDALADFRTTRHYDDDVNMTFAIANNAPIAFVDKGAEGRYLGEANQRIGIDSDVKLAIRRDGTRTIYEVVIPAASVPSMPLQPGAVMGVSLLVNDSDGNGRRSGLTISPPGTEPWGQPHLYPDLVLLPE